MKRLYSLEGKLVLLASVLVAAAVTVTVVVIHISGSIVSGLAISLALVVPMIVFAVHHFIRPVTKLITALGDGVASFKDGDFSINLDASRRDELGELARHYNTAGEILRQERYSLYQRELLLDAVIQSAPWVLLLTNANDRIVYSNIAARQLFNDGRKLEGFSFSDLLERSVPALREAVHGRSDGMFSMKLNDEDEIFYLNRRHFVLNAQRHTLFVLKQLTHELNRREVAIWKKVVRVISHELNNSLAPISSLAHSGRQLTNQSGEENLVGIFSTIEERSVHLKQFIEGYATFAKLPVPNIQRVSWKPFLESLGELVQFKLGAPPPSRSAEFDPGQLQQVLINLLKNAHESGSPPDAITLTIEQQQQGVRIEVADAGSGMTPDGLEQALLPFYSTKLSGSGLGLPLCREVVEAHGGRLRISNRAAGGLLATVWLPTAHTLPPATS